VTDDFIAHMRSDWDLGRASEFIVVASTLLALKAHRLLPHDENEEEPDLELLQARPPAKAPSPRGATSLPTGEPAPTATI